MEWLLPDQNNTPLVEWIYKTRGIDVNNKTFFNPQYNDLHSPLLLHDVEKVAEVLKEFIGTDKKIYIHGDFDVDGITATSIMWQFLYKDLKLNALPYIPSRFTEGYGLSEDSIGKILEAGAELIITVDCGVKDIEIVNKYSNKVKFIITDHHTLLSKNTEIDGGKISGEYLIADKALAVCHPRLGNYPFYELCGAAVSWKVCAAVNQILGLGIDMSKYLDLVSIGTVCDIMPLIDENRILVKLGLSQIKNTSNVGLKNLFKYLKVPLHEIDSYHLGFIIGPRINATGRLEDAMDAVRLLTTNNDLFARQITSKLDSLNLERQQLTSKFIEIAEIQIKNQAEDKLYFVYGDDWPEGIIGLIAGKLTEKYYRPVIVGSIKDGKVKASARSIEAFNIANNLTTHSTLLLTHGGHAQAAGLSLSHEKLEEFKAAIKGTAHNSLDGISLLKKLKIDALANLKEINAETYNKITQLSPFGMANKKPLIALLKVIPDKIKVFGKENNHIKLIFIVEGKELEAIAFNKAQEYQDFDFSKPIDIAASIEKNEWNGKVSIFLRIEDIKQ